MAWRYQWMLNGRRWRLYAYNAAQKLEIDVGSVVPEGRGYVATLTDTGLPSRRVTTAEAGRHWVEREFERRWGKDSGRSKPN